MLVVPGLSRLSIENPKDCDLLIPKGEARGG